MVVTVTDPIKWWVVTHRDKGGRGTPDQNTKRDWSSYVVSVENSRSRILPAIEDEVRGIFGRRGILQDDILQVRPVDPSLSLPYTTLYFHPPPLCRSRKVGSGPRLACVGSLTGVDSKYLVLIGRLWTGLRTGRLSTLYYLVMTKVGKTKSH